MLSGRSQSTLFNYSRKIAHISLHLGCLPEDVEDDRINEYLQGLVRQATTPSRSTFKHTVYGLRFYFRLIGQPKRSIDLPSIKRPNKLPVVLSREECRSLFKVPTLLKHRVLLSLIYATGVRISELCNLKIGDIDFDRSLVHIRQGKGSKDRYVPLSRLIARGLKQYMESEKPYIWLFNGKDYGEPISTKGVQYIMRESVRKTAISKENVCVHTLRHSFATHLLEDGLDIVTIQKLLGHASIENTMVYLHVMEPAQKVPHSPFDTLYPGIKQ